LLRGIIAWLVTDINPAACANRHFSRRLSFRSGRRLERLLVAGFEFIRLSRRGYDGGRTRSCSQLITEGQIISFLDAAHDLSWANAFIRVAVSLTLGLGDVIIAHRAFPFFFFFVPPYCSRLFNRSWATTTRPAAIPVLMPNM